MLGTLGAGDMGCWGHGYAGDTGCWGHGVLGTRGAGDMGCWGHRGEGRFLFCLVLIFSFKMCLLLF